MRTKQDTQVWTLYASDAANALCEVEGGLLALEHAPGSAEEVNRVYRSLHTVKGNSALLSLKHIESLAHAAEDVMGMVRDGLLSIDQAVADLLLGTVDVLRQVTAQAAMLHEDVPAVLVEPRVKELRAFLQRNGHEAPVFAAAASADGGVFLFSEQPPTERRPSRVPQPLPELDPDTLGMFLSLARSALMPDGVLPTSAAQVREIVQLLRGAAQRLGFAALLVTLDALERGLSDARAVSAEQLAPLGRELGELERALLRQVPSAAGYGFSGRFDGEPAPPHAPVPLVASPPTAATVPPPTAAAVAEPPRKRPSSPPAAREEAGRADFLRIDARKVSLVMDLTGEIGLACSAVTHHPDLEGRELEGFAAAAHKLEMLVRELQNEVSALRLVPIATVFHAMRRVVRDAARRTGKEVELVIQGEDTEIDKVMVDALHDPLVHVLRNAVDHGIEAPDVRRAAGKPEVGRVVLEAAHEGGEVCVTVTDDGQGLQRTRIQKRAVERGLCDADAALSDERMHELVFLPGFSTKEKIDELSGRGVGMDVIKTSIESLRGRVRLDSTEGKGSCLSLHMPLTMAFLDAMVVRDQGHLYALPIENVREVFKAEPEQVCMSAADGRVMLRVRDALVPLLRLCEYYAGVSCSGEGIAGSVVVVVQTARGPLGLPVDALLGNQPVMLKPLSGVIARVRAAAGCGMLRSGDVALTLDCEQLHA